MYLIAEHNLCCGAGGVVGEGVNTELTGGDGGEQNDPGVEEESVHKGVAVFPVGVCVCVKKQRQQQQRQKQETMSEFACVCISREARTVLLLLLLLHLLLLLLASIFHSHRVHGEKQEPDSQLEVARHHTQQQIEAENGEKNHSEKRKSWNRCAECLEERIEKGINGLGRENKENNVYQPCC